MAAKVSNICSDWPDMEVKAMTEVITHLPAQEQASMEANLANYKAMVEAGLEKRQPRLTEILNRIDPLLRYFWHEWKSMWCIQRANPFTRAWQTICYWPTDGLDEIEDAFFEGDIQRYESPMAYLNHKRAKAKLIRDENERKATEKLLAVIDSLPMRSIQEVLNVERALITGEKIVPQGDDAKVLNQMVDAQKGPNAMPQIPKEVRVSQRLHQMRLRDARKRKEGQ